MNKPLEKWQYPIGRYIPKQDFYGEEIERAIAILADFPNQLSIALDRCSKEDLDSPYRKGGWTIRQLTHHIADSHMHAYMRCKFAYLEERPLIKNYQDLEPAMTDVVMIGQLYNCCEQLGLHRINGVAINKPKG